jgi:hypothetical protein
VFRVMDRRAGYSCVAEHEWAPRFANERGCEGKDGAGTADGRRRGDEEVVMDEERADEVRALDGWTDGAA